MNPRPPDTQPFKLDAEKLRVVVRLGVFLALALLGRIVFPIAMQPFGSLLVVSALSTFAAAAVANGIVVRGWEHGRLSDFGLGWTRDSARESLTGVALGAGAAVLITIVAIGLRMASFGSAPVEGRAWVGIPVLAVVLLFGAAGEELLFHGYAFQLLARTIGDYATVLPVGILFGLAHAGNQNVTVLAIVNTVAWGVLLGCAYVRTRALWLSIGLHFGWNVAMPFLGVNLSGFTIGLTGYELRWSASALWSGGAYGFEGGLFTTAIVVVLFVVLYRFIPERG